MQVIRRKCEYCGVMASHDYKDKMPELIEAKIFGRTKYFCNKCYDNIGDKLDKLLMAIYHYGN